jgi:carbon monoxide dehydrogenase subunit G
VTAWLESSPADPTALGYRADVTVGGRLAILGEMVVRATANVLIGQLVSCLRARLESSPSGAGA